MCSACRDLRATRARSQRCPSTPRCRDYYYYYYYYYYLLLVANWACLCCVGHEVYYRERRQNLPHLGRRHWFDERDEKKKMSDLITCERERERERERETLQYTGRCCVSLGTCLEVLDGHTDEIFSCAFNYDGHTIITGSAFLLVFPVLCLSPFSAVCACVFVPPVVSGRSRELYDGLNWVGAPFLIFSLDFMKTQDRKRRKHFRFEG